MNTDLNQASVAEALTGLPSWNPPQGGVLEYINAFENEAIRRQLWPNGFPEICDEEGVVGDSTLHTRTCEILAFGLECHFRGRATFRVFRDLNTYYSKKKPKLFVAPDAMVVETPQPLPADLPSYHLGQDRPAPRLTAEVLSPRTFRKEDLESKPALYKRLGVQEYILIDVSGQLMPERLLLMRQQDGFWTKHQDADGGITSQLGFRLVIDTDGDLRVVDALTNRPYSRPLEAMLAAEQLAAEAEVRRQAEERQAAEAAARRQAEERIRALEEELARLRGNGPRANGSNPQT